MSIDEKIKKRMRELGQPQTVPHLYRMMLDQGFRGSEQAVRNWWNGVNPPGTDNIVFLSKALDCGVDYFFN